MEHLVKRDQDRVDEEAADRVRSEVKILAQVPLFSSLPETELEYLAEKLENREYPHGKVLFSEGERGHYFYVIIAGRLEIVKAMGTPDERVLAVRQAGEFVGEMSLFNPDGLRTASARALGSVRLKLLTRGDFDMLLDRNPGLAYEMVRVLSDRLTNTHNRVMGEFQEKNRQLSQAYEELKAAQAQLIEKEKLEHELELACEIQMSILPSKLPRLKGFSLGACIVPARAVGGDFYDFFHIDQRQLGVVIGDVTDKGVPAAIFMARTNAFLRAEALRGFSPEETLRAVNQHLVSMNDSMMFATVLYGILDLQTGDFWYARAGHELPFLCTPEGGATLLEMKSGMPLGLMAPSQVDTNRTRIPPGGVLLLYTDGVTDERSHDGQVFGTGRLGQVLEALNGQSAQQICDGIYQAVEDHMSGVEQFDDITLVAIRRTPA